MKIPQVFNDVSRRFCQDVGVLVSTEDDLVAFALEGASKSDWPALKVFLDSLLSSKIANEELQRIWYASPAEIYFQNVDHLKLVLSKMRDRIDG